MDRAFLTRQIDVFLQHEPLFADATEEYRAMTVRDFVQHLAGNWEQIVKGQEQLVARKAALEQRQEPGVGGAVRPNDDPVEHSLNWADHQPDFHRERKPHANC